ncbi:MAG: hypothetical protein OMM_06165 [Candidatus Magnetoglobus multicellularis str. Araruama]|uniref:Uncharacterized protein n=1 Tax=Candidatus Magnetoglobus multicellularis str. Araruama TaxID=890399 RepID=A0A1V1NQR2_9BACT|nr:MAG: hypothetical protein OMM_06165 [Candidatus Magnetoglobus multicellularis str. Araruama]
MMCGNDPVIREIHAGGVCHSYDLPDYVRPISLSAPTLPIWPQYEGKELWTLIHSLGLNYNSINTKESLQRLFTMYNRNDDRANHRRIEGIRSYQIDTKRSIYQGYPVNAVLVDLLMATDNFINKGDMLMFCHILSKFFSMYVPMNNICELNVTEYETNKHFMRQVEAGGQSII